MSHVHSAYPQVTTHEALWFIREDDEEYAHDPEALVELTDKVIDRLQKAEAVAWLLNSAKEFPDGTLVNASWLIAELVHEALETHELQWEIVRRDYEPKKS